MNENQTRPAIATPSQRTTANLNVVLLPSLIDPDSLVNKTVIVVDVLRATTTIVNALNHGAIQVLPQPSVEAARTAHDAHNGESLIGGERGGKIVDGFHQGNSPIEYTPEVITGKTLILATTNGTVAMEQCRAAKRILIGAMVNLDAVAKAVESDSQVTVMCSGTDRIITSEDVMFAGALMDRLLKLRAETDALPDVLTDTAKLALDHWRTTEGAIQAGKPLADFFRNARGGINLVKIGHDADIVFASQINTVPVVPELDVASWSIRLRA